MRRRLPNANQQLEEGVSSVPCPAPGGASLGRASEEKDSLTQHVEESCQKEVPFKNIIKKKGGGEIKTGKHGIHGKCTRAKHGV